MLDIIAYSTLTRFMRLGTVLLYLLLISYGSLYPFNGWRVPPDGSLAFLSAPWPRIITRTDLITNILAYLPLGYLLASWLRQYLPRWQTAVWATLAAGLFSLAMESAQTFLPGRIASNLDLLTNLTGALCGIGVYRLLQYSKWPGRLLPVWRGNRFAPGLWGDTGLLIMALWGLSQLSLEVPSLVAGNLKTRFIPVWELSSNWHLFQPLHALLYGLEGALATLFFASLLRQRPRTAGAWASLYCLALACKLLAAALLLKGWVLPRLLSAEMLAGIALAVLLIIWAGHTPRGVRTRIIAVGLAGAGALQWHLHSGMTGALSGTSVSGAVPLNITALANWMGLTWPFLVALHLGWHPTGSARKGTGSA